MEGFTPAEERLREIAKRKKYAGDIGELFAHLAEHPGTPMPYQVVRREVEFNFFGANPQADIAAVTKTFRCGTWEKRTYGIETAYFEMTGEWRGWKIHVSAYRDAVCKRVVTGTEDREVEEIVTPAVTRMVTKPVEIVAWECEPATKSADLAPEMVPAGAVAAS
jgi:hypothetical protein